MTPPPPLLLILLSPLLAKCHYSTLTDNVAMDSKTLASIVTDIDSHYDHLLTYYSNKTDQVGGGADNSVATVDSVGAVVGGAGGEALGWTDPGTSLTWDSSIGSGGDGHLHPFENSVSFEGSGLKLALIFISLWYLIIAVMATSSTTNLFGSTCGASHQNVPFFDEHAATLIDGNAVFPLIPPHPLTPEIISSFLEAKDSSEEQDFQMPLELLQKVGEMCPQSAFFYGMNPGYMTAAMMVKDMFMELPSSELMLNMAMKIKPMMNTKLWYTGLMHACSARRDMTGLPLPTALDAMPDSFVPGLVDKSRGGHHDDECIKLDGNVGKDNGEENKLWYFREDVMVNSHHWYWHLAWPLMTRGAGRMDRRGELFYYAHRSFVQRYNIERLCNNLAIAEPLDYTAPVTPGYHPHLTDATAGQDWTPRERLAFFRDINHRENPSDRVEIKISDWLQRKMRLIDAVKSGYFVTPKGKRRIPSKTGIDMLGNTLEAVDISVNPMYYGRDGFHNDGHRIIGYIEDPDFEKMLPPGVMADPATAMRDPIFYRFHTNVNEIFEKYKATLEPYTDSDLSWPGVTLKSVRVVSKSGNINELKTFWDKKSYELNMGLAFNRTDDHEHEVEVCSKHLNHEEFEYFFDVYRAPCAKSKSNTATFRVFLAPKYDPHSGKKLTVHEQRNFFTHLDVFNVKLPPGWSTVTRSSLSSSLTIPPQQTLTQLNSPTPSATPNCGCGWPHHLLLPKGSKKGKPFSLFVMVTNGDDFIPPPKETTCAKGWLYCGVANGFYPDKKPMGFPFDRPIKGVGCQGGLFGGCKRKVLWLEEYVQGSGGSMESVEVVVVHEKKKGKKD